MHSLAPLVWAILRMGEDGERGFDWAGPPVIAIVARLLCRALTLRNGYLLVENRTLRPKIPGRLHFTDETCRSLTEAALAMGQSLMEEAVGILEPDGLSLGRLYRAPMVWQEQRRIAHARGKEGLHSATGARPAPRRNPLS